MNTSRQVAQKLPEHCLTRDHVNGGCMLLTRGRVGSSPTDSREAPETYNYRLGLTYEQVDAMEYGSVLGFDIPLADPDYVRTLREELGQPVGPLTAPA